MEIISVTFWELKTDEYQILIGWPKKISQELFPAVFFLKFKKTALFLITRSFKLFRNVKSFELSQRIGINVTCALLV